MRQVHGIGEGQRQQVVVAVLDDVRGTGVWQRTEHEEGVRQGGAIHARVGQLIEARGLLGEFRLAQTELAEQAIRRRHQGVRARTDQIHADGSVAQQGGEIGIGTAQVGHLGSHQQVQRLDIKRDHLAHVLTAGTRQPAADEGEVDRTGVHFVERVLGADRRDDLDVEPVARRGRRQVVLRDVVAFACQAAGGQSESTVGADVERRTQTYPIGDASTDDNRHHQQSHRRRAQCDEQAARWSAWGCPHGHVTSREESNAAPVTGR